MFSSPKSLIPAIKAGFAGKNLFLFILFVTISGCINFKDIGSDLGEGLTTSLQGKDSLFSSIGGNITKGAADSLINERMSRNLTRMLDSVIINFSATSKREVSGLIDSLLADYVAIRLQKIGRSFEQELAKLPDDLLGDRTSYLLRNLRDDLVGDETTFRLAVLRDELLGDKTSGLVDSIIASALNTVLFKYEGSRGMFREDLGFIQKNASTILVTAGVIIAALIIIGGIVYYKKNKMQKVSEVLSMQIHNIPDQKQYDELVKRIQQKAQENKIEPELRKILEEQGILGKQGWRPAA
jgi:hypothetical protein